MALRKRRHQAEWRNVIEPTQSPPAAEQAAIDRHREAGLNELA